MAKTSTTDFVQSGPLSEALNGAPVVVTQNPAGTWNIDAPGTTAAALTTALALVSPEANGSFTSTLTVPAASGLDTNAAGALALGATNATSVVATPPLTATASVRGLQSSSTVVTSTAVAATKTQLATIPVVPAVTLRVGSLVRATVTGTCTSSNADTATFLLTAGVLGTTGDATVASFAVTTAGSGTAIAFKAVIDFVVRTLGASGTGAGSLTVLNVGTTGLAAAAVTVVPATSSTFATTTATAVGLNLTTAATSATAIQTATLEVIA